MVFFGGDNRLQLWKLNESGEVKNEKHRRRLESLLLEFTSCPEKFYPLWETAEMRGLIELIKQTEVYDDDLMELMNDVRDRIFSIDQKISVEIGDRKLSVTQRILFPRAIAFRRMKCETVKVKALPSKVAEQFCRYLETGVCQPTRRTILPLLELQFHYGCQPLFVILATFLKESGVKSKFLNDQYVSGDWYMDVDDMSTLIEDVKSQLEISEETFKVVLADRELQLTEKILLKRAPGFLQILNADMKETHNSTIQVDDLAPEVVEQFSTYLSTGRCQPTVETLLPLFKMADLYHCDRLVKVLIAALPEDLNSLELSQWIDICEYLKLFNNKKISRIVEGVIKAFSSLGPEELRALRFEVPVERLAIVDLDADKIKDRAISMAVIQLKDRLAQEDMPSDWVSELFHFPYLVPGEERGVFAHFRLWLDTPLTDNYQIKENVAEKVRICSRLLQLNDEVLGKLGLLRTNVEKAFACVHQKKMDLAFRSLQLDIEYHNRRGIVYLDKLLTDLEKKVETPEEKMELGKRVGAFLQSNYPQELTSWIRRLNDEQLKLLGISK